MRIAKVIGRITTTRLHPSFKGARFVLAVPMTGDELRNDSAPRGEEVVVYDDLGASPGGLIGLSEGGEAANPFRNPRLPIDAYNACLLDRIEI
jgi:microcompartment protein CcmK/EutM